MLQVHRAPEGQRVQLGRREPQGRLAPSGPPGQEALSVLPGQLGLPALWAPRGQWDLPVPPAQLGQLEPQVLQVHKGRSGQPVQLEQRGCLE